MDEKYINSKLTECGLNLTARLAARTIIFGRPKLFPASWDSARWEQFEKTQSKVIEQMQKLICDHEVLESEDV